MPPAISVLMPVYNAQRYLKEAIDSILKQSFRDFEFIIINDGSTDDSAEIVSSYNDQRIRFFDFDDNQGIAKVLNFGLAHAQGKYIARMDADDIAHQERLMKQYRFLEANSDYIVCGTRFHFLENSQPVLLPLSNEEIKLKMLHITPLCHPSVMIRNQILKVNAITYDPDKVPTEDHDLWVRLSALGKFHNLEESLLDYRLHGDNSSLKVRTPLQRQRFSETRFSYIEFFFKDAKISSSDAQTLHQLFFEERQWSYEELKKAGETIRKIIARNSLFPVSSEKVYNFLAERYYYRCTTSTSLGLKSFSLANHYDFMKISFLNNIKLLIKAILKFTP